MISDSERRARAAGIQAMIERSLGDMKVPDAADVLGLLLEHLDVLLDELTTEAEGRR